MAAGLGFKDFTTGEVLTAADVDGYLMQGVWVFASATARDAAVTSPQEGNFAYLKDTNVTTYYTGSAWANLDTTGMTNPMTTTGDTIYSSSGSTPARLGIGTAGQVLTVNSGATAPEWAAPAGGGKVLQVVQDTDTSGFSTASTTYQDTGLSVTITPSSASSKVLITVAGVQGYFVHSGSQTAAYGNFRLVRTSTQLQEVIGGAYGLASSSGKTFYFTPNFGYLDSPATTSATTYKVQGRCESGGSTTAAYTASATIIASIVAYEIGA
jgi:hypothetical protein